MTGLHWVTLLVGFVIGAFLGPMLLSAIGITRAGG